jgi:hypothetical protein
MRKKGAFSLYSRVREDKIEQKLPLYLENNGW